MHKADILTVAYGALHLMATASFDGKVDVVKHIYFYELVHNFTSHVFIPCRLWYGTLFLTIFLNS